MINLHIDLLLVKWTFGYLVLPCGRHYCLNWGFNVAIQLYWKSVLAKITWEYFNQVHDKMSVDLVLTRKTYRFHTCAAYWRKPMNHFIWYLSHWLYSHILMWRMNETTLGCQVSVFQLFSYFDSRHSYSNFQVMSWCLSS